MCACLLAAKAMRQGIEAEKAEEEGRHQHRQAFLVVDIALGSLGLDHHKAFECMAVVDIDVGTVVVGIAAVVVVLAIPFACVRLYPPPPLWLLLFAPVLLVFASVCANRENQAFA